jgi:hypothetical protein|tara:strand:+ start:30 stop:500 length:471 start_codon:yes stop_codon:yes gene_type:complete
MSQKLIKNFRDNHSYTEMIEWLDLYEEVDNLIDEALLNHVNQILTQEFDHFEEEKYYYDENLTLIWLPLQGNPVLDRFCYLAERSVFRELGIILSIIKSGEKKLDIFSGEKEGTYYLVPQKLLNYFQADSSDKEHLELICSYYVAENPVKYIISED